MKRAVEFLLRVLGTMFTAVEFLAREACHHEESSRVFLKWLLSMVSTGVFS
jgi:hypothetical protein